MINPIDLLVFNTFTVALFVYVLGLALTATAFEDNPPTDRRLTNCYLALVWPLTLPILAAVRICRRLTPTRRTDTVAPTKGIS